MGEELKQTEFSRAHRREYRRKVQLCLDVFETMLAQASFDFEKPLTGMEIECNLVDSAYQPAMNNSDVLETIADPAYQTELGAYNIEFNVPPRRLPGRAALELEDEVRASLNAAESKANTDGSHIVMIGILPTLMPEHLSGSWMSESTRYQALNDSIFTARGEDIDIDISGPERQLWACQHLRGVPIPCEVGRRHLQVQLHAGTSRFGRNGGRFQAQPLGPADVDQDVFTACGEDRIVERLIPDRLAHPLAREVFGHQRREDADHDDVRIVLVGLGFGRVQAGPHLGLELECRLAGQTAWRNVEFDVVGAQFGLVGRIGDCLQHFPVAHGGLVCGVDEVALDLHAGQRPLELETGLVEHGFEDVEALLHLAPVLAAVRPRVLGVPHFFAHVSSLSAGGHHDLRIHQAAAQIHLDRRICVLGERAQRRRTVGAQRADDAVVHVRKERRQRQHRREPDEMQR